MKKLVNSGLHLSLRTTAAIIATSAALAFSTHLNAQGCVMSCPPMDPPVEIFLSSACEDVLTYQDIGVVLNNCPGEITVDIMDNGMSLGDTVTADMIGNTYMVIISHPMSGQSCMTSIIVLDQEDPVLICPGDVTLECTTDLSSYNGLDPGDISDCSSTQVFIDDVPQWSGNCMGNIVSQYVRTYTVVDAHNNSSTCEQIISLEKASLSDVVFPPSLAGPDALDCYPPPDTSPDATGYPTVNGNPIVNGVFCNLSAFKIDNIVPICSGSYKIMRSWTVTDWCDNNTSTTALQVIEVLDSTPPVVDAPPDMTISTGPANCTADANVPPAIITDDCSNMWTVRMVGTFGTIHSNGGIIPGLPVGVHRVIFRATSDCNLEGADTMYVTVQDLVPPTPVCNQGLAIPVNHLGTAIIPASVFNGASTDNCGQVFFKVKRMTTPVGYSCANPGNPNNMFDDFIQFCCDDIEHNNIMVILRVYDVQPIAGPVGDNYLQGRFNDCMVQVEVQDKLPPQVICPSDLTISCEFPFTLDNLEVFGSIALSEAEREQICIDDPGVPGDPGLQCIGLDGLATDNCSVSVDEGDPIVNINNCGTGTLIRTFTVMDDGGLVSTCQQTITIINYDLFDLSHISWPPDYTTFDVCEIDLLDPEDLPPPYNQPVLDDGICDLVAATYEDLVFDFSNQDQACFKILRTWTVIDWCQINTQSGGIWTKLQVIKVMNNSAPVIAPIEDITRCSFDPACGGLVIDFAASAEDDCSGPASLTWKYFIDLDNDGSFDFTSGNIIGESIQFSRNMPIGTHRILFTVGDKCGNTSAEEQFVTIESCKPPSAKCIHGLSTNLMAMDLDGDGTADWGMVTLQASMFDAGSDHPCGNEITVAFSADPTDVSRVFDCEDIGEVEIEIWAIDENGLTDFCITNVIIQDNFGICPPQGGGTGVISGNVQVPQSGSLSGAMVYLEGSNFPGSPTGSNGQFVFPPMPFGGNYVVKPVRDGDYRNGVTTLDLVKIQKHLLGIETFQSPFQYIAADANNSSTVTAIDIIQLRKLILGIDTELPNNSSWRFVDKAYIFPDPQNPWASLWPETYTIIPFSASMHEVDFNAIKIGDLNLSANLQMGSGMILPRGSQVCELEYTVIPQPEANVYQVDIYLLAGHQYNGFQFSFDWDKAGYALKDWSPGKSFSRDEIRMPETLADNASIAAYSLQGWSTEPTPVLTLWVEQITSNTLPFRLFLNPGPTPSLAHIQISEDPIRLQLNPGKITPVQIHNRPNPFQDMTIIYMESNQDEPAVLRIYDLNGRLVNSRKVSLTKGENEFVVRKTDLRSTGIFMYEIESSFQYSTNRMIIVD